MRFQLWKKKTDLVFLGITLGLVVFGLVVLSSASGPLGYSNYKDSFYFVKHQILYGVIPGLILLFIMLRIPYRFWRKFALPLLGVGLLLLLAVFIPGIGADFGTARSWIDIGGFTLQPAEIVKLTFLFYLAAWLESRGEEGARDFRTGLIPFLIVLGLIMGLLLLQPDLGSMAIIVFEALAVYFVAGSSIKHLIGIGLGGVALLWAMIKVAPYRAARLTTFLHPELDPQGIGYHINQALLAVGSGGFWGLGFGHSRQKFQYLPEVQGDSIYAIMAEELGFIISAALIIMFLVFLWRGLKIINEAPDAFGKFVGIGILSWIVFQAFVNIGAMIGLVPITGVPLPFISFGGTAMFVNLAAVGVLLNISSQNR